MQKSQSPYTKIKPETNRPYTQIYLIRHCTPDYSLKEKLTDFDLPLSKIGKVQRKYLNKKLKSLNLSSIYASELLRAKQTAELYAKNNKKKLNIEKRLNEIDWINWYKIKYFNMSENTRIKKFTYYQQLDRQLDNYQAKGRRLIADLWRKEKGRKIALFCHGNIIRAILTGILNTDVIGFLSMEIYQSSISKIVIDKNGYVKINYINNIDHLPHRPEEDLFLAALNQ